MAMGAGTWESQIKKPESALQGLVWTGRGQKEKVKKGSGGRKPKQRAQEQNFQGERMTKFERSWRLMPSM